MVGGIVIKPIETETCLTLVVRGEGCEANDLLHVDVERGHDVKPGDVVWWQGKQVFWTRRGSRFENIFTDIPLRKIGYSYGHCHV